VLVVLPFTIPLTIVIAAIVLSRVRRQTRLRSKQDWESYQLTMSRNVLRRFVASLPAVEILRPEVSRILDSPGQGLSVVANPSRFIFIPEQLVGYASVREQLASWRAFEPARAARAELTRLGWTLLMLSLWVATGMLPQFWLGMLAGAALLVVASLSLRATLKLQVFDNKYKARAVGALGFFMLAPFARALLHFGFGMDVVWPQ
jgi:hypothetical protein